MQDLLFWKSRFLYEQTTETLEVYKRIEDKAESPIEVIAMIGLMNLYGYFGMFNLFIHQQNTIGNYRVDFLVSYHSNTAGNVKIIVECDGHEFHEKTKQQAARDKARDRELTKLGYKVLRYTGSEICNNPLQPVSDIIGIIRPNSSEEGGQGGREANGEQGNQHFEKVQH